MAHGPRVASVRCVLFALSVRMDEPGEAYPSQSKIAADTALSDRTVREAVQSARRAGWLAVTDHVRPGQAWRLSHYVACIPDTLDLSTVSLGGDVDLEKMADQWAAQHGDILDPMHGDSAGADGHGRRRKSKRKTQREEVASGPSGAKTKSTPETCGNQRHEGAEIGAKGAEADRRKVRKQLPTKFPSKVPIGSSHREGRALTRTTDARAKVISRRETRADPSARRPLTAEAGLRLALVHVAAGLDVDRAADEARRCGYPVSAREVRSALEQQSATGLAQGGTAQPASIPESDAKRVYP